ncbi:MAG: CoA pyrophosphatase [Betaproteobacteria bacterium]|nr:MAG: CoA pyrophosphatase [Betaproteobacteria bacterium]
MKIDDIRARVQHAARAPQTPSGDGTHEERKLAHTAQGRVVKPAAVLVLLQVHSDGLHVVLTQRTAHLHDHAGQISFPGGRKDDTDGSLIETALREANEEICTDASLIEVIGALPTYVTITAYEVTPIVAVSPPQSFRCDPFEVADVFTVPLSHLLDDQQWRRDSFMRAGTRREYWAVPYRERYIWGATAGMLRTFKDTIANTK